MKQKKTLRKIEISRQFIDLIEPFSTVGTVIDKQWKVDHLSKEQFDEVKERFEKVSNFMFEQFDEMQANHPDTSLEFIYESMEELHSEMGALLLVLLHKFHWKIFEETKI